MPFCASVGKRVDASSPTRGLEEAKSGPGGRGHGSRRARRRRPRGAPAAERNAAPPISGSGARGPRLPRAAGCATDVARLRVLADRVADARLVLRRRVADGAFEGGPSLRSRRRVCSAPRWPRRARSTPPIGSRGANARIGLFRRRYRHREASTQSLPKVEPGSGGTAGPHAGVAHRALPIRETGTPGRREGEVRNASDASGIRTRWTESGFGRVRSLRLRSGSAVAVALAGGGGPEPMFPATRPRVDAHWLQPAENAS